MEKIKKNDELIISAERSMMNGALIGRKHKEKTISIVHQSLFTVDRSAWMIHSSFKTFIV